jgi:hypothetical protein
MSVNCVGYFCLAVNFWKVQFTAVIIPKFWGLTEPNISEGIFSWHILLVIICITMSVGSPQRRVCQRTKGRCGSF